MSDTHIENTIIQAIEIVAGKRISQAGYDRTYTAVVKSVLDAASGKYEIKYQDATYEAYATSANVHYSEGDQVFILIPQNDTNRVKTIIGGVKNSPTTFNQIKQQNELYNQIGPNCILGNQVHALSSYGQSRNIIYDKSIWEKKQEIEKIFKAYPVSEGAVEDITGESIQKVLDEIGNEQSEDFIRLSELRDSLTNDEWDLINKIIDVDQNEAKTYVNQSTGIVIGMTVQTNLASSQYGGNYGFIFTLNFTDNITGAAATRSYIVDARDVIGNPYLLKKATKVEHLFSEIDTEHFESIQRIEVFCNKFPEDESKFPTEENENGIYDIFLTDLHFCGAQVLKEGKLTGYFLNIDYSTNGKILRQTKIDDTKTLGEVTLIGQLKIGGKIITENVQYYWFKQNGLIFKGNAKYSPYGGDGWECLNNISDGTNNTIIEPNLDGTLILTSASFVRQDQTKRCLKALAEERITKIKCVAVSGLIEEQATIDIINQNIKNDIYIDSSDKKQISGENKVDYYLDAGCPTLTCIYPEQDEHTYIYTWSIIPARGQAYKVESKTGDITAYHQYYQAWEEAKKFRDSLDTVGAQAYVLTGEYLNAKANYDTVKDLLLVEGKVLHNFPISSITEATKIVCTVQEIVEEDGESNNVYKGSASITLFNHMQVEGMYSLNIENGTQVFQYDTKGNSPASAHLTNPLEIKPLSFALFDNEGREITYEQIVNNGYVEWIIPRTDTMLSSNEEKNGKPINFVYGPYGLNNSMAWAQVNNQTNLNLKGTDLALAANENSYIFKDSKDRDDELYKSMSQFYYTIDDHYDVKKKNNYIRLDIKYKQLLLTAYTNFTFPKDGDPGTNGTDFVAKLVPIDVITDENGKEKQIVELSTDRIYIENNGLSSYNIFNDEGRQVKGLKIKLFNNSQEVESFNSPFWSCPPKGAEKDQNKGKGSWIGTSNSTTNPYICSIDPAIPFDFILEFNDGTQYDNSNGKELIPSVPIDIIRGKTVLKDLNYYAEHPVCINYRTKENYAYRFKIKPKTGFQYVVYAEDGTSPSYDNTLPFEAIVEKYGTQGYYIKQTDVQVEWHTIGNLSGYTVDNKFYCQPLDNFNGYDLSSAVVAVFKKDNVDLGFLHVPIYMILNRYNHSEINDWDGNSVQIDKDGNGVILAPQVGAGKKDSNNTFTGVLMGVQHNIGEEEYEETGLFGYHKGQRSIFLDAETGKAQFGKNGSGKVTIDPGLHVKVKRVKLTQDGKPVIDVNGKQVEQDVYEDAGLIYSGNYKLPDSTEIGGYPTIELNVSQHKPGHGMIIDLSTPQFGFGSGDFYITREGHIHAGGGGDIAGWTVSDNMLYSTYRDEENNITQKTGIASGGISVESIGGMWPNKDASVAFFAGRTKDAEDANGPTAVVIQSTAGDGETVWQFYGNKPFGNEIVDKEDNDEEQNLPVDPGQAGVTSEDDNEDDEISGDDTPTTPTIQKYTVTYEYSDKESYKDIYNEIEELYRQRTGENELPTDGGTYEEDEQRIITPPQIGPYYITDKKDSNYGIYSIKWEPATANPVKDIIFKGTISKSEYTKDNPRPCYEKYDFSGGKDVELPLEVIQQLEKMQLSWEQDDNYIIGGVSSDFEPKTSFEDIPIPIGEGSDDPFAAQDATTWHFKGWEKITDPESLYTTFIGKWQSSVQKKYSSDCSFVLKDNEKNQYSQITIPEITKNKPSQLTKKYFYLPGDEISKPTLSNSQTYYIKGINVYTLTGWEYTFKNKDWLGTQNWNPWEEKTIKIEDKGVLIRGVWQWREAESPQSVGNFYVTHDGFLYSRYGKIATWDINPFYISNGIVGIGEPKPTESIVFKYNTTGDSASTIKIEDARIWSGQEENNKYKNFVVSSEGKLYAKAGYIGPWEISEDSLSSGSIGMGNKIVNGTEKFDLPKTKTGNKEEDTIIKAKFWSLSGSSSNNFAVSNKGQLYASGGKIGGWNITRNQLYSGDPEDGNDGMRISASGGINGGTKNGGYWSISSSGKASFTNIEATGGTIGGWNIDANKIYSTNSNGITLNSSGSMEGPGWSIDSTGNASFSYIHGKIDSTGSDSNNSLIGGGGYTGGGYTLQGGNTPFIGVGNDSGGYTKINPDGLEINYGSDSTWEIAGQGIVGTSSSIIVTGTLEAKQTISAGQHINAGQGFCCPDEDTGMGRSGTLTFSDGSNMVFKGGILTDVNPKTSDVRWNGN